MRNEKTPREATCFSATAATFFSAAADCLSLKKAGRVAAACYYRFLLLLPICALALRPLRQLPHTYARKLFGLAATYPIYARGPDYITKAAFLSIEKVINKRHFSIDSRARALL